MILIVYNLVDRIVTFLHGHKNAPLSQSVSHELKLQTEKNLLKTFLKIAQNKEVTLTKDVSDT